MGRGFMAMIATLALHPRVQIVAGTDPRSEARERFARDFRARVHDTFEDLCSDDQVEAIYIASPHQYHRQQVMHAARCGKHILVEKPMALSLDDCRAMSDATLAANVVLVVGHSHGFDAPIAQTQKLVSSGTYGALRMITSMNYTDFLYRPRRPEELDTSQGGGVVFSQASHQVDIVRTIAGGMAVSVRASAGVWDSRRPTESAYSAHLTFTDGVVATLVYSGHAHFDSDEFCEWVGETGQLKEQRGHTQARRRLKALASPEQEAALKHSRGYGSAGYTGIDLTAFDSQHARYHEHFGLVLVSCDSADLRPGPRGVAVYGDDSESFLSLPRPVVPRSEVIDELYAAIVDGTPALHSGSWGTANLEVCLAILQSSREGREIELRHQVGIDGAYNI
jgi:phthalate 4,5-cis-dihydrodiol dehydrogenase